jgi:hypothetical protein
MKKKLLITLIAASVIGIANASSGYRILSESHHVSGAVESHLDARPPIVTKLNQSNLKSGLGRSTTSVTSKSVRINENVTIDSTNHIDIINDTAQPQIYPVSLDLGALTADSYYVRNIELDPNSQYSQDFYNYLTVQPTPMDIGSWKIFAVTNVQHLYSSQSGYSKDEATLYVTK